MSGLARIAWLVSVVACAPLPAPVQPAPPPPTAVDDADLVALVPAPVEAVLWIDVARLRASAWARPMIAAAPAEEREGRTQERGFDEIADVDVWVLAKAPAAGGKPAATLEVLRGRFDHDRLRRAFVAAHPGATAKQEGPVAILSAGDDALAFLTQGTVVLGAATAVREAVAAAWKRAASARDEGWLARVLASLDDEGGRRSSAAVLELAFLPPPDVRAEAALLLGYGGDAVERLGARLFLDETARAVVVASASDKYAAASLGRALGNGVQALKARRSIGALGLRSVLEKLRLSARGARVVAELTVSEDERDTFAERMAALAQLVSRTRAADQRP